MEAFKKIKSDQDNMNNNNNINPNNNNVNPNKNENTDSNNIDDDTNQQYFDSYAPFEVHQLMVADQPRTEAYLEAIKKNLSKIENKIVMDVGCGTGILSMFCAKYGKAKKVIAVERSDMAHYAKKLVEINNLSHIVEVHQVSVEDLKVEDLKMDTEKVDIIVSEWMGFYLFHEGMLDSVLVARDKFLKEGGLMFPESATMFCA